MTCAHAPVDADIVRVLIALGTDLTACEWAERLDVPLDVVLGAAASSPYTQVKPEAPPSSTTLRRFDRAAAIVSAISRGHCVPKDIAAYTGLHRQTIYSKLTLLEAQGVVYRCGSGTKSRWFAK
jgi:hypothetical protein